MSPLLDVRALKVSIRTDEGLAQVLDDVSLVLQKGRILGVVGESGCGKSTLIRAVMGILPRGARVDRGEIWFEGENLLAFSEDELNRTVRSSRIGFIPQDPLLALNPVFKVGTQLLEVMRWHAPDDGNPGGTAHAAPPALRHDGRPARPDERPHRPQRDAAKLRRPRARHLRRPGDHRHDGLRHHDPHRPPQPRA